MLIWSPSTVQFCLQKTCLGQEKKKSITLVSVLNSLSPKESDNCQSCLEKGRSSESGVTSSSTRLRWDWICSLIKSNPQILLSTWLSSFMNICFSSRLLIETVALYFSQPSTFLLIFNTCCYKQVYYYSNLLVLYMKIGCGKSRIWTKAREGEEEKLMVCCENGIKMQLDITTFL